MQRDTTDPNPSGLTDQQQRAAVLLVSGVTVQDVADQLEIHRTTLWHWRNLETFQAYLNQLRADAQEHAVGGMVALREKALATVERLLECGSDGISLRAAALVLEAAQTRSAGETDPRRLIRDRAAAESNKFMLDALMPGASDVTYRSRCKELGIEP